MAERRGWPRGGGYTVADAGWCNTCKKLGDRDEEGLCRDCAFMAKARTISIIAEPWALREVRRQYGHNGMTDRASEYKKAKHEDEPDPPMLSVDMGSDE